MWRQARDRTARVRRTRGLAASLLAALVALGSSCDDPSTLPRWTPLAQNVPENAIARGSSRFESVAGRAFELVERDGHEWLRTTLQREEWLRGDVTDGAFWLIEVAVFSTGRPIDGTPPQRLYTPAGEGAAEEYEYVGPRNDLMDVKYDLGQFYASKSGILLKLGPDELPPEELVLEVFADHARYRDGRLRVGGERFSGDGFGLWPGERIDRTLDVPPNSTLRFATCIEPAVVDLKQPGTTPARFRVELDGQPIFSSDVHDLATDTLRHHAVPLPKEGRRGARLTFTVEGGAAFATFLAPVVGPSVIGTYDDRAALDDTAGSDAEGQTERRPDLIVFLADTFRADNLAAYGRTDGLTPYLDRFAEANRVYPRMWSVGTYTLPAHFSMFAGVYPLQIGASGTQRALPRAWTTLAEHLSEHGYRTGAVTESVFVSRDYSFDQGFEWWDERIEPLEKTLTRVRDFLDADDGRPVFLFVQTYRTHTPYVVQPATKERLGLPAGAEWKPLNAQYQALPEPRSEQPGFRQLLDAIEALYRGTAADLDSGFQRFHQDLLRRGLNRSGYLVFTSDHGEAFHEHDLLYHTGKVWEELVRVPLIISGPGIEAGRDPGAVSLVDLAPSLCDMAGVEPRPEWLGSSWLTSERRNRPVFLFQCQKPPSTLGVVDGFHKVIDMQRTIGTTAAPFGAFDLESDPGEQVNLSGSELAWPAQVLSTFGETLRRACEPVITPEDAGIDPEKAAELKAMGYTGE